MRLESSIVFLLHDAPLLPGPPHRVISGQEFDLDRCRADIDKGTFLAPPLDLLFRANSSPLFVCGAQRSLPFHLQNHRGEVLLFSLLRLHRINLIGRSCGGHVRAHRSREVENQTEILVPKP